MRWIVGDVQGCVREVEQLLGAIEFDRTRDQLWSTGDLINRGPDSLATIRLWRALGGRAVIGNHVRVKVVKNKVAPPFRQAEFDVMFDEGISHTSLLVDLASEAGIIQKSGAWYSYGDQRIGQGRENAKLFLRDNPVLLTEVEGKVKELLGMRAPVGVGAVAGDEAD